MCFAGCEKMRADPNNKYTNRVYITFTFKFPSACKQSQQKQSSMYCSSNKNRTLQLCGTIQNGSQKKKKERKKANGIQLLHLSSLLKSTASLA